MQDAIDPEGVEQQCSTLVCILNGDSSERKVFSGPEALRLDAN